MEGAQGARSMTRARALAAGACAVVLSAGTASAIDAAHKAKADALAAKAESFLLAHQDKATGGWSVPEAPKADPGKPEAQAPSQPHMPGITGLVLRGLVMNPKMSHDDLAITSGVKYLLSHQQPDGGIYDRAAPAYNTSLAISALSQIKQPYAQDAVKPALKFLRHLQWGEEADGVVGGKEAAKPVTKDHPFYGGVGYGRSGRPDTSNLNMFMDALQDAGVPSTDPAVQRALVFLSRTQMLDEVNDMPYADGSRQGGFVYSTAENAESIDKRAGQSQAGTMEETLSDGTTASRLRAYGSMTYAGFKSYAYAKLDRDDVRVTSALGWIKSNYTVDENPGMGSEGQYYYYLTFSRALAAWGEAGFDVKVNEGVQRRDWANDLVDKLETLQEPDGQFRSVNKRWMEDNPVLITAYSLIALREAQQSPLVAGAGAPLQTTQTRPGAKPAGDGPAKPAGGVH